MNLPINLRNESRLVFGLILLLPFISIPGVAPCQTPSSKPLLIIKVENEGDNLTRHSGVSDLTAEELSTLRKELRQNLGGVFTVIPESDGRDCIELGISIEKVSTASQTLYVASSVIAVGKGKSDLLLTHNALVQPSLEKVEAAVNYQLSSMVLQSQLRSILK
jgi:hypothetical protein